MNNTPLADKLTHHHSIITNASSIRRPAISGENVMDDVEDAHAKPLGIGATQGGACKVARSSLWGR